MAHFERPLDRIVAHRGASADAPENTLASLQLAIDHGAQSVEVDAMISSDEVPYLHHDDGLARCTNGDGYLCAASAKTLDELDASNNMAAFKGEPLPRLAAAIDLLIANNIGLNLEIKPTPGLEAQTAIAVTKVLKNRWPEHLALVLSSFSKDALEAAKIAMPEAPRALITCAIPSDWQNALSQLDCRNFHMAAPLLDADSAKAIKAAGYGLYCYTVNDIDPAKQLLSWGVDGVFTDKPKALLEAIT